MINSNTEICNLKNLHYAEEDKLKVLKLIHDTTRDNTQARTCIARYNANPEAFDQIITSICIEPLLIGLPVSDGGGTRLTWNIYANPPSQTPLSVYLYEYIHDGTAVLNNAGGNNLPAEGNVTRLPQEPY
jgi:hypothetical protein